MSQVKVQMIKLQAVYLNDLKTSDPQFPHIQNAGNYPSHSLVRLM